MLRFVFVLNRLFESSLDPVGPFACANTGFVLST